MTTRTSDDEYRERRSHPPATNTYPDSASPTVRHQTAERRLLSAPISVGSGISRRRDLPVPMSSRALIGIAVCPAAAAWLSRASDLQLDGTYATVLRDGR
jgi:hypothetical protein